MKILYVVQRYGESIVGGSEAATRMFAEHLATHEHQVEVLTSCAQSYNDWGNVFEPGTSVLNDVVVHRVPVAEPRRAERFGRLHGLMIAGSKPIPMYQQQRWAKHMGPDCVEMTRWLAANCARFDVVVFMTYLYSTATRGMPVVATRVPLILQPTAHDEPPIWLPLYDTLFRLPDAFLFFTPEEHDFVARRFALEPAGEVVGIGIDLTQAAKTAEFRAQIGIGDDPYLIYLGRIDSTKGSSEAYNFFLEYQRRNARRLKFVFVGDKISDIPDHPDVVFAGFLDEEMKRSALAGALALVQPSRFESFSIVLCESWVQNRPAIVHADCAVLLGQARRSGGAVPYAGFAEFEAALDLLLDDPQLADCMGRAGHRYVAEHYTWDKVLAGVERTFELAVSRFRGR
jgi:glycosyltransferase involved in cell wall biosynthesis